jgi:hypothetical protein
VIGCLHFRKFSLIGSASRSVPPNPIEALYLGQKATTKPSPPLWDFPTARSNQDDSSPSRLIHIKNKERRELKEKNTGEGSERHKKTATTHICN